MKKILVIMHDFRGGGAEKVSISLCNELDAMGYSVAICCLNKSGAFIDTISPSITLFSTDKKRMIFSIFSIKKTIKEWCPSLIISHLTHVNVTAIISSLMCLEHKKLLVVEHSQMTRNYQQKESYFDKLVYLSTLVLYRFAGKCVGVSKGVSDEMSSFSKVSRDKVITIYNPVIDDSMLSISKESNLHKFYDLDVPVYIFVGRLIKSKKVTDFIKAVGIVNKSNNCRALILGDGPTSNELLELITELKLDTTIELIGFRQNVYEFIKASDSLVLTSEWEGLPTVLIEALALGTQVVSTDCKSGPSEILENGKYGFLAPVGDVKEIAEAMLLSISSQKNICPKHLSKFSRNYACKKYLEQL